MSLYFFDPLFFLCQLLSTACEISKFAASKFSSVSRQVIQHAFEVFELRETTGYLQSTKKLALQLLSPWLSNILLTAEDLEEKGLFSSLLHATFSYTEATIDCVPCWKALASHPNRSSGNIATIVAHMLAALARCPQAFSLATEITSVVYSVDVDEALAPLVSQLSDAGLDWNRGADKVAQSAESASISVFKWLHPDSPNIPSGALSHEARCQAASRV